MLKNLLSILCVFCISGNTAPVDAASATITLLDCKRVVEHQASAGVAFRPGFGANNSKVKPADLEPPYILKLPKEFSVNIGFDITKKYSLGSKNIKVEMVAGKITLK